MSEMERIHDQLRRAYEGDAWHGPSVKELLTGVTAEQAAKRNFSDAHTIWEIVLHINAWAAATCRTMRDAATMPLPPWEGDWPPVRETSPAAWAETLAQLERTHRELLDALTSFPEARLAETVPGRQYNHYMLLHGIVQHDLYHAGQIALLRKL